MVLDIIENYWNTYGFDLLVAFSILFLIIYACFRIGKKGTFSTPESIFNTPSLKRKKIVKDSKGEIICRNYLEKRFNVLFPKIRPDFLRNPVTGGDYNLELDCYNDNLKLAVEYNGIQHYKFSPFFHRNNEAFLNQKYRDEMKRYKCKEANIKLIEVPYTIPHNKIENFLETELKKINL
jgi:hypothetical protein